MKTLKIMLIAIFLPVFYGCDELVDELKEVDITATYSDTVRVSVYEKIDEEEPTRVQESGGFDLINNPDVADAIGTPEQIKKVEILNLQYEYKNFSGNVDANMENGFFLLTLSPDDGSFPISDTNIAESDLYGTVFNVPGNFEAVSNIVSQRKIFVYVFQGHASHNPAFFDLEVTLTLRLTVELNLDDL